MVSMGPLKYLYGQKFEEIREKCLRNGELFKDEKFPPTAASFYGSIDVMKPKFQYPWLRPGEFVETPVFVNDGYSRFDIEQGGVGDCWFLASIATFAKFQKDLPEFWQYGEWVEVVVDDFLPSVPKYPPRTLSVQSSDPNEFWGALLEKAYAKLYGSYNALDGGRPDEAYVDLTGGFSLTCGIVDFEDLLASFNQNNIMCSCDFLEKEKNLKTGHAYSVTDVKVVPFEILGAQGTARMLRLRNPWGSSEWTGPGSDKSEVWKYMSTEIKKVLDLKETEDGEFWMSYDKEFRKLLKSFSFCFLLPLDTEQNYNLQSREGKWDDCLLTTTEDKVDGKIEWAVTTYTIVVQENKTNVFISLTDKNRRKNGLASQVLQIFVSKLHDNATIESLGARDASTNKTLNSGVYNIKLMSCTKDFKKGNGTYLLRIIHDKPVVINEDATTTTNNTESQQKD